MIMTETENTSASDDKKRIKVTLVWGGTGESKEAEVKEDDMAGHVFDLVFERFHQKKSDQDTYEVNGKDFPASKFTETVKSLIKQFGDELVFEVIPPTSGA